MWHFVCGFSIETETTNVFIHGMLQSAKEPTSKPRFLGMSKK
jgi:hypothetical protein